MASQSLYRKWRSQTFGELVGQKPVIDTLKNALESGKLAHAYLFAGPRGTGKTSTARLLAKTINCLHPQNGEPCNECDQCREITAGNSFNVVEIDAASNRGIDSIRELREKVLVPPTIGKYKVYILDEAHMLTVEAFNALLKTLEEPPPHAIFVMATTDVHKMLPTVLSRCQRFDFKRITTRQIVEHLKFIAGQEQIHLDQGAAELIARAASGGMRDALSLLDQAIAYCGQEVSLSKVQAMLGVADPRAIQKFIMHVANVDSAGGLHLIHELSEAGADLRQINGQVAEYWRAMMLARAGADIATILDSTEDEVHEIQQCTQYFTLEELVECARVFAQNDLIQKNQGTPQLALELALLTCVELHRRAQNASAVHAMPAEQPMRAATNASRSLSPAQAARPAAEAQAMRSQISIAPEASPTRSQPASLVEPASEPASPEPALSPVTPLQPTTEALEDLGAASLTSALFLDQTDNQMVEDAGTPRSSPSAPSELIVQQEAAPLPVKSESVGDNPPSLTIQDVKEKWELIKRRIRTKKDGYKIAAFLNAYSIIAVEGTAEQPIVFIQAGGQVHFNSLQKPEYQEAIEWGMGIELQQACRVRLLPPNADISALRIPPPSPSSPFGANGQAAQASMPAMPKQSARREPLPPATRTRREVPAQQDGPQASAPASLQSTAAPAHASNASPPLARKSIVRENSTAVSSQSEPTPLTGTSRLEVARKKATQDPVVQKVVDMFKAEIKDINLK
jgi:DNA polymerase-3 subunit gamma/tau